MAASDYQEIKDRLRPLCVDDARPWLIGFSGGKDSTFLASLAFEAFLSIPPDRRTKLVSVLCADTRNHGVGRKDVQRAQRRTLRSAATRELATRPDFR